MSNLDFHTILYYYAVFCLAFSPVSIGVFVFLYRKTNLLDRVDRFVDRLLGEKPAPAAGGAREAAPGGGEDKPELSGIACFNLHVGDEYYCRSRTRFSEDNLHEVRWSTDNDFLGEMGADGLFRAVRTGSVNIFCTRKDDDFDDGAHAYSINILPTDQKWVGDRLAGAVTRRMRREDVLAMNIKRKTLDEKVSKGIIAFAARDRVPATVLQFDREGFLERGVYEFRNADALLPALEAALEERYERVELDDERVQIWIHKIISDTRDEIDTYCYIRTMRNGSVAFCVSNAWREYGATEEFLLNVKMAARIFEDCLPGEPVPDIHARKARKTAAKRTDDPEPVQAQEDGNATVPAPAAETPGTEPGPQSAPEDAASAEDIREAEAEAAPEGGEDEGTEGGSKEGETGKTEEKNETEETEDKEEGGEVDFEDVEDALKGMPDYDF